MADLGYKTGRLCGKYIVENADGTPVDDGAAFFVLRLDSDPHARRAIIAYAASSRSEEKTLALREAYNVRKADGSPVEPQAELCALWLDGDRHARRALRAYAVSVAQENKPFAREILAMLWEFTESDHIQCGCREAMCPHTPFVSKEGMEQLKAERAIL